MNDRLSLTLTFLCLGAAACGSADAQPPRSVEVFDSRGDVLQGSYFVVVPDDTSEAELREMIRILDRNTLKTVSWGIRSLSKRVYVFRQSDREAVSAFRNPQGSVSVVDDIDPEEALAAARAGRKTAAEIAQEQESERRQKGILRKVVCYFQSTHPDDLPPDGMTLAALGHPYVEHEIVIRRNADGIYRRRRETVDLLN